MEGNHSVATGQTRSEDLWTCNRCGWTYPNPHPSAKHRRNHKKHCGKIKGFEIHAEHHNGGSSGEASSDDEQGKEGVEHVTQNKVESLALATEPEKPASIPEKPASILSQSDAKPDQSLPATPMEFQSTLSEGNVTIEKTSSSNLPELPPEISTTKHDSIHSSDVKPLPSEDSNSYTPASTFPPDKISQDKGLENALVEGEPSPPRTPTDKDETVVPLEIIETAILPDLPNIDPAKTITLANSGESDSGFSNKASNAAVIQGETLQSNKVVEGDLSQISIPSDTTEKTEANKASNAAVIQGETLQSNKVVEGDLSRIPIPSDTKEKAEAVDYSGTTITPTIPNVDVAKHSITVVQEQSPYLQKASEDDHIDEATEPVDSSEAPISFASQSGDGTEHLAIDNIRNSEIKVIEQGADVSNELDPAKRTTGGSEDSCEQNNQSLLISNSEDVVHRETSVTSSEIGQQDAIRTSHVEQGSDNEEGSLTKLQEAATIKKDSVILGSETGSVPVQLTESLLDVERIRDIDKEFSHNDEGRGFATASQSSETVIEGNEFVNVERQPDILETASTSTVSTVEQILEDKPTPKQSEPHQDSVLTAGRKLESEKEGVPQQDNILVADNPEDNAKANQSVPQQDNITSVSFEAKHEKETLQQQENILAAGNPEDKATPDNVRAVGSDAQTENQSVNAEAVENSLKKSYSVPESSIALTGEPMVVKNVSTRRTDSMDTEAYEDAPDTLEACSVAGSVAGSIEENDIFQSLSDTSARLDAVPSFIEKGKIRGDSPENASFAERTNSFPTKGVFNKQDVNLKAPSPEAWQESNIGSGRRNGSFKEEEPRQRKGTTSSSSSDAGKSQTALGSLMAKEAPQRTESSTTVPPKQKSKSFWSHCICCATVH